MRMKDDSRQTTYLTATDKRTKRSKCATVYDVTPSQLLKAIKRGIAKGGNTSVSMSANAAPGN